MRSSKMSTSRCLKSLGNLYLNLSETEELREEFNKLPEESKDFIRLIPVTEQAKANRQKAMELNTRLNELSIARVPLEDEVRQCRTSGKL